jgi:hypothetical protein
VIVETLQARKPRHAVIACALLAAVSIAAAVAPVSAQAQAVCDEYSISPLCRDGDRDGGGGPTGGGPGDGVFSGGGPEGDAVALTSELAADDAANPERAVKAAKGELPVAGYPATPVVLLLAALLGAGLLIRIYLAVRDRRRMRAEGGPLDPG